MIHCRNKKEINTNPQKKFITHTNFQNSRYLQLQIREIHVSKYSTNNFHRIWDRNTYYHPTSK